MATSMNKNMQETKSTVGLLLVIGEIISNEQRDEICIHLKPAFTKINNNKYHEIIDVFNNLIHENEFQTDSQYRQITDTENGSVAGFVYLPSYHTLLNVFNDVFNTCYHVCIIYCGQQIDSNGALILSDSIFTCDNFYSLFEENSSYVVQDLQIILPFISNQWIKLANNYLEKKLKKIQINTLSDEIDQENSFGQIFYERLIQILTKDSVNFDIYTKLIPRDNSGTIAFDEPNLYILYGQQGEASLFGVRGFVVLVNGGFSRIPSFWNLIRGLQNIDACILTHFDYDVFPGLQTILHRKTISSQHDNPLCKPDIGAIFLNHTQRTKIQSVEHSSKSSSNSKLLINLNENINEFLNDIKQLNINTIDLVKNSMSHKTNIEPINLYKKIAFGSLDLYILHPTTSISDDEKMLTTLQKIPIRDQQPSSSIIPFHHWYSSCLLLVWTPSSISSKDSLVRILYTGACPQTLVFEALNKVRHLEFLHEPQQQQQQKTHISNINTTMSTNTNIGVKQSTDKPKISSSVTDRVTSSTVQSKTPKVLPRSIPSKPKVSQSKIIKSEKPQSTPVTRKTPPLTTNSAARSNNKDKKTQKSRETTSKSSTKPDQTKNHVQKVKPQDNQQQKLDVQNKDEQKSDVQNEDQEKSDVQNEDQEKLDVQNEDQEKSDVQNKDQEKPDVQNEDQEKSDVQNKDQEKLDVQNEHEQKLETQNDETERSNEIQGDLSFQNDNEEQIQEKNEHEISSVELNEKNETSIDNHEDEIQQPESVSLTTDHNERFVENHTDLPIDGIQPKLDPNDSMTTSVIGETSNTKNSFIIEKINDNNNNNNSDDEMEIIHHDISSTNQHSIPSNDEINPQGLPIENDAHSIKPTIKKLSNTSNRTNEPSKSTNNTNQTSSSQKSKQTSLSNPIFNVDVAYIPFHGNEHYVDKEFFRRVRARYYILNAVQINHLTLESLIDGKQQWENKEHAPVTLVPTFDGEQLRQFFVMNRNRLAELNINILPASIRCNVQYDNEGSPSQLLRFSSRYNTDE
ncbi:unnamed protein product [Rotaria sordida]|uniref:Microtubule-associated protein 1A/B/S-like MBL-like domain-containing protein n=1 Tax=Rotaria sordida TaxID=392033 RepID=A0A813PMN2_9BILA|nr:unnamed protein product [Rotaria sordida]CAF3491911.1 unnamed protein product [Rotaria sordida]